MDFNLWELGDPQEGKAGPTQALSGVQTPGSRFSGSCRLRGLRGPAAVSPGEEPSTWANLGGAAGGLRGGRRRLRGEQAGSEPGRPKETHRASSAADMSGTLRDMEEAGGGGGNDRVRNLQSEVEGVKNIMTQNVERILARGENLDHLRNKTEDLEATSEHFKTTSQKVARKFWWKNVKMIVIICVVVFIIILFIVLFATGAIPT